MSTRLGGISPHCAMSCLGSMPKQPIVLQGFYILPFLNPPIALEPTTGDDSNWFMSTLTLLSSKKGICMRSRPRKYLYHILSKQLRSGILNSSMGNHCTPNCGNILTCFPVDLFPCLVHYCWSGNSLPTQFWKVFRPELGNIRGRAEIWLTSLFNVMIRLIPFAVLKLQ